MLRRAALLLLLVPASSALAGCAPGPQGGQIGGEADECGDGVVTPLDLDAMSPLGFSGADVLALVEGTHTGVLTWSKGGSTEVTVTVAHDGGQARYVDLPDSVSPGDGTSRDPRTGVLMVGCLDGMVLDAKLGLSTADGAFAESWSTTLFAIMLNQGFQDAAIDVSAQINLDVDALKGTYQVTEVDPSSFDATPIYVNLTFDAGGVHGKITGDAIENGNADDPESAASATMFDVASF